MSAPSELGHRIQMRHHGHWHTLGGLYSQTEASDRVSQFSDAFMVRSIPKNPTSQLACNREFRIVRM